MGPERPEHIHRGIDDETAPGEGKKERNEMTKEQNRDGEREGKRAWRENWGEIVGRGKRVGRIQYSIRSSPYTNNVIVCVCV